MSNALGSHGLQHASLPWLSPGVCSNSCLLSQWCCLPISSSAVLFSFCLQSFPASRSVFSSELTIHIRWPKYWSFNFSISPSNEYSGLISFRIYWFDLLLQHHNSKASVLGPQLSLCSSSHICTFSSVIHYKNSHNSPNMLYLWLQFYYKGYSSGTAKWKRYTEQDPGEEGGKTECPCPVLTESGMSTFQHISMFTESGRSTELQCTEFLYEGFIM